MRSPAGRSCRVSALSLFTRAPRKTAALQNRSIVRRAWRRMKVREEASSSASNPERTEPSGSGTPRRRPTRTGSGAGAPPSLRHWAALRVPHDKLLQTPVLRTPDLADSCRLTSGQVSSPWAAYRGTNMSAASTRALRRRGSSSLTRLGSPSPATRWDSRTYIPTQGTSWESLRVAAVALTRLTAQMARTRPV